MKTLYRSAAFLFAVLLILSSAAFQADARARFLDVPAKSWFTEAVEWAVDQGITAGTSEAYFSPKGLCTRGQIVTLLWRQAGSPEVSGLKNPFSDVQTGKYYYRAVLWAVSKGITEGSSRTSFEPNKPCTRAQIVTFLWRAAGSEQLQVDQSSFRDVNPKKYYAPAVFWAISKGITAGTNSTSFSPSENCTRAQAVTFIYRCFSGIAPTPSQSVHLYRLTDSAKASCSGPQTKSYHCILCGLDVTETEGEASHEFMLLSVSPVSCTRPKTNLYKCIKCGKKLSEAVGEALGHDVRVEDTTFSQYPRPDNPVFTGTGSCLRCKQTAPLEFTLRPHDAISEEEKKLISLINRDRRKHKSSELVFDVQYFDCSKWRAYECFEHIDNQHSRPDGSPFYSILEDLQLSVGAVGENILYSTERDMSAERIHEKFLASPGHRENLLDPDWQACTVYILRFCDLTVCLEHFYILP